MHNPKMRAFVMISLVVSAGCQSQPVALECQRPEAPPAWMMQKHEPNLTQRMLNELSESPRTEIQQSLP